MRYDGVNLIKSISANRIRQGHDVKKLIVGNWKMHHNTHQASLLLHHLTHEVHSSSRVEVVLCPNFLVIQSLSLQVDHKKFKLGAQNCDWHDEGAFTGEVSAAMLHGLVSYVIVGHSERRHIFHESDVVIRKKVQAAIRNKIKPILCIGETARERADDETAQVIHDQIISGLANVTSEEIKHIVIAYEPVWAIGSGENALPAEVAKVASMIRRQIAALYGRQAADEVRILYGGSVSAENAGAYVSLNGVDGLLVGGASLIASSFAHIVEAAANVQENKL